jgi:septal ring factor EnvC (AmiA/AmiB activator)
MKRDIRDLFKEEGELKTLPENHSVEFLEKLQKQPKEKSKAFFWLSIAAVAIIGLIVGFNLFYNEPLEEDISPMIAQIEAVEAEYLKDIEKEWENFIAIAEDEILVERFKKKLNKLDKDYQEISAQFKNYSNDIMVVESLIDNLQTRLQILKDIQEHIKILNQNNGHYEKSI